MSEQVQGVVTTEGHDISAICNLASARHDLPPRVLVAQAIAESDLTEQAARFGDWPDVSFGLWQQTVAFAPIGDRSASPENVAFCRQRFCHDVAFAADVAASQLAGYYHAHGESFFEASSRYNGGPALRFAENPNRDNIARAWEQSARYAAAAAPAAAESPVAERVLAAAARLIGTPYGLPPGPGELDCSSFIRAACADAGVPFPSGVRTAEQLRLHGELVTSEANWNNGLIRRGDLLFFEHTGGENPGERAGHVGFALMDLRMLDANETHGVNFTPLSAWWQERLFEARRPPQYAVPLAPGAPTLEEGEGADLARLRAQLAEERSFNSALMHDVIRVAREQLETLARRERLTTPAADLAATIQLLRQHEA